MEFSDSSDSSFSGGCLNLEIEIDRIARWDVYFHLQELSVPCQCKHGQALRVQVSHATAAIQLWSVVQAFAAPQQSQIDHLQRCWQVQAVA
ncbi:MAG: Asr1405/Asl0597 family protein [Cyanobacteria bacterium P01_D01_bin.115]